MTRNHDSDPWRGLPSTVADLIEPELGRVTEEILATIGREVPEYARPLEGAFGRGVRTGVEEALRQFVSLVRDPDAGREPGREVYLALGRGELRQGRTLDSLQAAYRVGARVAWRRLSEVGRGAGLDPEALSLLAEAIFAYIEELSADSVEGFAQARAEAEDARRRHRTELAAILTRGPVADEAEIRSAAGEAGWALPGVAAAAACEERDLGALARGLPADVLAAPLDGLGCLLIPDPDGPGRRRSIERAAAGRPVALGPTGGLRDLHLSWPLARSALRAAEASAVSSDGLLIAEDRLTAILMFENGPLVRRIAARRLAPVEGLTPKARERMLETASSYVRHLGSPTAMADALHIHPQTARYRIARLRELLGEELDDPDARFELELALRSLPPSEERSAG
jgi:hypothetical protein